MGEGGGASLSCLRLAWEPWRHTYSVLLTPWCLSSLSLSVSVSLGARGGSSQALFHNFPAENSRLVKLRAGASASSKRRWTDEWAKVAMGVFAKDKKD